jgi:Fur family ferric uptake transcriptional regulator
MPSSRAPLQGFTDYLSRAGLKTTRQRERIVRAFFAAGRHVSAEELHRQIRATDPGIGLVTVYRTLKLLRAAGLATERQFGDAYARFDPRPADSPHHHLICTACGRIVEFEDGMLADLARRVKRARGFTVTEQRVELYGLCRACAAGTADAPARRAAGGGATP